jgi:agarase
MDAGAVIRLGGARVPDIFDPAWPQTAALRAGEVCLRWSERRDLIGWLTDDPLGWAETGHGTRPTLLQICLSLEPSFAAYHAAWEFTLALHGGRLDSLARSWAQPITNKEVVRELTRSDHGIRSRGYLRDDARWSQEFARRYFALTSAAIRAHDPHHLILGCRFAGRAGHAVLAECRYPAVDVPWMDIDDVPLVQPGPVIVGDFTWVDERFLSAPSAGRARVLTTVERMLRRGRTTLERAARNPGIVGYAWRTWRDGAGEQPPFASGLVHGNDREAREHTELLADANPRLHALRRSAAPPYTS